MAPDTIIIMLLPRILPIPVSMEAVTFVSFIPRARPVITHTTRKARNGLTLNPAMRITRKTKARNTINKAMTVYVMTGEKIENSQGSAKPRIMI
jgi:hypothetical protein